jgi:biopolymer transport protein ExbD
MAISVGGEGGDDKPMSDINTTPLVDVMLVMLIIFLITIPVVIQNVKVKLPDVKFEPTTTKPENVSLSIREAKDGSCEVYWNQTKLHFNELVEKANAKLVLEQAKNGGKLTMETLPEAHIRGDVDTPYRCIGGAIYAMQYAGFLKIGFISEPPAGTDVQRI